MRISGLIFRQLSWLFALAIIYLGLQSQTENPTTRADNGPGFDLLAKARQSKSEEKYLLGCTQALEAARQMRANAAWTGWGESLEEAYLCARNLDSAKLYRTLLPEFESATKLITNIPDVPVGAKALLWERTGRIHHSLGAYDAAEACYQKALPFAEQNTDTVILTRLYGNTAIVIWHQGDDYRSLEYFEKSLSLATMRRDTPMLAAITTNLGNVWRTLDPPKSVQVYLQALALNPDDPETLMLLSKAYLEGEKNLPKALATAQESLRYAEDEEEKSDALHQLGRVYFDMGQYNTAMRYYDKALVFANSGYGPSNPECAKIHVFRGRIFAQKKDYHNALLAFNKTMDDLLPLFTPTDESSLPAAAELTSSSLWILEALLGKAGVYEQLFQENGHENDLNRSLECAELALFYQNKIKLRYGDDESKYALASYFSPSVEAALRAAFSLYRTTGSPAFARRAFSISEQTKAVVLAEALYKNEMKNVANVPREMQDKGRRSLEQIAYFEKLLESQGDVPISVVKDSLFQAKRQLEILDQQIQASYPAYGNALFSYRTESSPDSARRSLPDDAALVEYFLGDSAIYTFLVAKDTFWVQQMAIPAHFNQTITNFLRTVKDWQFVSDSTAEASRLFLDSGNSLYQWLLEQPLAVTKAQRLFIIPDGKLSLVPFELLQTKPYPGKWIDRDVPFLMKEKSVSYRFSCHNQQRQHAATEEGWGGFGLEYDEGTLSVLDNRATSTGLRDFGALPFADDEIMAIKGVLGGSFWLNGNATRENFLKNAERYGILHLAMHGFVDERNPLRSKLLFSRTKAGDDPFVYAADLYNMQLNAGLSVLSACQSGAGAWKKGEGVMSLARAFAFAGCPSMVMSLWNVSDQSTSDLMVSFYKNLKDGATKDEALRAAKLNYLQTVSPEYAKPIYWAAFVPIGEMNSMDAGYFNNARSGTMVWWALAGILLMVLGIWGAIRLWYFLRKN